MNRETPELICIGLFDVDCRYSTLFGLNGCKCSKKNPNMLHPVASNHTIGVNWMNFGYFVGEKWKNWSYF